MVDERERKQAEQDRKTSTQPETTRGKQGNGR